MFQNNVCTYEPNKIIIICKYVTRIPLNFVYTSHDYQRTFIFLTERDRGERDYIGFATLPEQVHRKSVKRGFDFTLMVVGESGLGKSTLINSLFLGDLYRNRKIPDAQGKEREAWLIRIYYVKLGTQKKKEFRLLIYISYNLQIE